MCIKKCIKEWLRRYPRLLRLAVDIRHPLKGFAARCARRARRAHWETKGKLYPENYFYVLRVVPTSSGWGALLPILISGLNRAEQEKIPGEERKKFIPVIDLSDYYVMLEPAEVGNINAYELFFEQPTRYGLRAVEQAQHVFLNQADYWNIYPRDFTCDRLIEDAALRARAHELYRRYMHLSSRIKKEIEQSENSLFSPGEKVLGVICRGSSYFNAVGEHIQPDFTQISEKAAELKDAWGADSIFLATEDENAFAVFRRRFGDELKSIPRMRYDSNVKNTNVVHFERQNDNYCKQLEYLKEIVLISRCSFLLAGRTGMLSAVMVINGGAYAKQYIYDLGIQV